MYAIQEVSALDMAFGCKAMSLMPKYKDIPDDFKHGRTKWNNLFSDWFFCGLASLKLTPKKGVDQKKALAHIKVIIGSFEPPHEHKEAGAAYLLSEWFEDAEWECAKKKKA